MQRKGGTIKRNSWIDVVAAAADGGQELTLQVRQLLSDIDELLFDAWNLGNNIILAWTRLDGEYLFLAVRHYVILEPLENGAGSQGSVSDTESFINAILAGPKFVPLPDFERICSVLGKKSLVLRNRFEQGMLPSDALISRMVARYGVSLVPKRAVVLIDAVGFSLRSPLEQVAMLNSISYSVNSAYRQLVSRNVEINFARTTTGDGFYIWNRAQTIEANIALYELVMLVLADNAVAQQKAQWFPVPVLRAAFHVGEHYEFYQVEGLNPTTFGYIVGQVTIELSRMIEQALPGQILLGDFNIEMDSGDQVGTRYNTTDFVARTVSKIEQLRGLDIAGDQIDAIRCYLTGNATPDGSFLVNRYALRDKHDITRTVYNAKINIHRRKDEPIFLGIQHSALHPPGSAHPVWPIVTD